jgi:hypothetical protein
MVWWLLWGTIIGIGAYFHAYVLQTAIYGGIFIVLSVFSTHSTDREDTKRQVVGFLGCLLTVLLFIMPGYLFFISDDSYRYELFQYGGNIWSVTATGMGWPVHRYLPQSLLLIIFTVVGTGITLSQHRSDSRLVSLLLSLPCIIITIFLMNMMKGYWYLPRQLIHLQTTIGLGVPRLLDGYAFSKGNARALTDRLQQLSGDKNVVYIQPAYEMKLYEFDAATTTSNTFVAVLRPATWEEILEPTTDFRRQYLIAPPSYIANHIFQLSSAGYRPLLEPPTDEGYLRSLWGRP